MLILVDEGEKLKPTKSKNIIVSCNCRIKLPYKQTQSYTTNIIFLVIVACVYIEKKV